MKRTLTLLLMAAITYTLSAQIDLHSHAVTDSYLAFIKEHHAEMDEGFPIPHWDVAAHLAFMDRAGIETSVLTMPAPQPWFGDGAAAAAVGRWWNEECALLKARHPGRFRFCAALPLPDVTQAILLIDGGVIASIRTGQFQLQG